MLGILDLMKVGGREALRRCDYDDAFPGDGDGAG